MNTTFSINFVAGLNANYFPSRFQDNKLTFMFHNLNKMARDGLCFDQYVLIQYVLITPVSSDPVPLVVCCTDDSKKGKGVAPEDGGEDVAEDDSVRRQGTLYYVQVTFLASTLN
jgi:hypothetical protein